MACLIAPFRFGISNILHPSILFGKTNEWAPPYRTTSPFSLEVSAESKHPSELAELGLLGRIPLEQQCYTYMFLQAEPALSNLATGRAPLFHSQSRHLTITLVWLLKLLVTPAPDRSRSTNSPRLTFYFME